MMVVVMMVATVVMMVVVMVVMMIRQPHVRARIRLGVRSGSAGIRRAGGPQKGDGIWDRLEQICI